jgi:hypothetical protein
MPPSSSSLKVGVCCTRALFGQTADSHLVVKRPTLPSVGSQTLMQPRWRRLRWANTPPREPSGRKLRRPSSGFPIWITAKRRLLLRVLASGACQSGRSSNRHSGSQPLKELYPKKLGNIPREQRLSDFLRAARLDHTRLRFPNDRHQGDQQHLEIIQRDACQRVRRHARAARDAARRGSRASEDEMLVWIDRAPGYIRSGRRPDYDPKSEFTGRNHIGPYNR